MKTTAQIKQRIQTTLIDAGLPSDTNAIAKVWQCYQEPMYGSDAWDDIDASIEDALEISR